MGFAPIAVVGQGCVLPSALDPAELWELVRLGRSAIGEVPADEWRIDAAVDRGRIDERSESGRRGPAGFAGGEGGLSLSIDERSESGRRGPAGFAGGEGGLSLSIDERRGSGALPLSIDRELASRQGGYVRGFERVWDPRGFQVDAGALAGLDPVFTWTLHAAREAVRSAGLDPLEARPRGAVVLGNLSFPVPALVDFAVDVWRGGGSAVDPRNRFMSGLPAQLVAAALGFGAGGFCLDAACASSLYAIKLACDRLHDGSVDLALAGGVNHADDLFLHLGFTALSALSPTGRSRPFHRAADGLVPAHGAAVVLLRRLADAEARGDRILAVIRGVGVANDGRGRGLLVPVEPGQVRAMRAAYAASGIAPHEISLVECHATGTAVGDAVELRSMREVFTGVDDLPIGSLKSNLGHLITASGAAALLKVIAAMAAGIRPASLHADEPLDELAAGPFRVLAAAEPWRCEGPRRAAISNFGFGGNNSHLVVEEWRPRAQPGRAGRPPAPLVEAVETVEVAVIAQEVITGGAVDGAAFAAALFDGGATGPTGTASTAIAEFELDAAQLRFPPSDLEVALAQQTLLCRAVLALGDAIARLPRDRTGVLVGMQCDAEVARCSLRWRRRDADAGRPTAGPLDAGVVLGCMPNVVANRLNSAFDLRGPSFTVSADEASGTVALDLALRGLAAGETDAAVVCAVDLCCEPVQRAAAAAVLPPARRVPGDAAVVLVLKRLADARRDGDPVHAVLAPATPGAPAHDEVVTGVADADGLAAWLGHAHAAAGLLQVAAAVTACAHRAIAAGPGSPAVPWLSGASGRRTRVVVDALGGTRTAVVVRHEPGAPPVQRAASARPAPVVRPASKLRLAAHMPPVRFAAPADARSPVAVAADAGVPDVAAAADAEWEVMAPAPPLPPVLDLAAAASRPPIAVGAEPPRSLIAVGTELPRPPIAAGGPQALAAVHAAFLHHQAAAHAEFLRILIGSPGGSPPSSTPGPPPPVPLVPLPLAPPSPLALPVASPPVASPPVAPPLPRAPAPPSGPVFDRAQLETLASGQISSVFGPRFAAQDGYARQVRMPEPPLLLADRVLGIAGAPGEMGLGTIWTETDVDDDAWYLHAGRMPAGILVEAGQADLLLISWLGVDAHNRGERVYRLLGCELTSHGELPRPGDRLRYEIHVDGHAQQGDIRLFFFHYDCWVNGELRMTVRHGQAGFFSDAELAATSGVLWSADTAAPTPGARLDPPAVACEKRALTPADIAAFVDGRADACFGPGFERLAAHTRTPAIQGGRMRLFDEVTRLELDGGPWRRGYLRAELALRSDHWFFAGHFHGDPCMPGTLMFEGCLQALATYLVALGFTLDRDGWRFEPVAEHTYHLRCRGQAVPSSRRVVYEVFVDEVIAGPTPTIFADLLGTVDGVRAFHCRRMGLRLVPDYPLDGDRALGAALATAGAARATVPLGDPRAMLACAWGRPSQAFGEMYRVFDGPRRVPRLPGPPYHAMSRVTRVDGPIGGRRIGSTVEVEYDVPPDAWYFADSHTARMPYCVLLEIALQPCGWLASYAGCALIGDADRALRNLDGTGVVHREVGRDAGTLITWATLVSLSIAAGIVLVGFDVTVRAGAAEVMTVRTGFGLFDADSLEHQVGLPGADDAGPAGPSMDLVRRAGPYFTGTLRLPTGRLLMLDRIAALDPAGGSAGLGRIRAEQDVLPGDWFFRAHFFQDPVQPGSLGLDAMLQALAFLMIERGMAAGIAAPRFEAVAAGVAMTWKYRGQIVPENHRITVDVAITRAARDARGALAEATGSLWVDGKRIYEASGLGVCIVAGHPDDAAPVRFDPAAARRFWREATSMTGPWVGEDLMFALLDRFVGDIDLAAALPRRARRGVVYLANHQVAIETLLAALIIGGLTETVPVLVAKIEHRDSWLGALTRRLADRPGYRDPDLLRLVDRRDPAALLRERDRLVGELAAGRSVVVHVEGTRATSCRPVSAIGAAFVDLALEAAVDIVPLRFAGGLPIAGSARLEFPVGYARQDHRFGRPIAASELRGLPLAARLDRVRAAINGLGAPAEAEAPAAPDPAFAAQVAGLVARGVPEPQAVLWRTLAERGEAAEELSPEGRAICAELARLDAGGRPDTRPWFAGLVAWLRGCPVREL